MTTAKNVLANRLLSGRLKFGYPPLDLLSVRHSGECSLSPIAHASELAGLLGTSFIGRGCDHLVNLWRETGWSISRQASWPTQTSPPAAKATGNDAPLVHPNWRGRRTVTTPPHRTVDSEQTGPCD